jgi:hypothetical protein
MKTAVCTFSYSGSLAQAELPLEKNDPGAPTLGNDGDPSTIRMFPAAARNGGCQRYVRHQPWCLFVLAVCLAGLPGMVRAQDPALPRNTAPHAISGDHVEPDWESKKRDTHIFFYQ